MTDGVVFGRGDRVLGKQVRDEVICQNTIRKAKAKVTEANNKKKVRELVAKVDDIRQEMMSTLFVMLNRHIEKLIRYKTLKVDNKLPSKKNADMLQQWKKIQGCRSSHAGPYNSGEEYEGGIINDDDNSDNNEDSKDSRYVNDDDLVDF